MINQKQFIEYTGISAAELPINLSTLKKNHFRGIGPSIGFDACWEFYSGLCLSSELSASLLYGKFDVHNTPVAMEAENVIEFNLSSHKKHRLRPTVDAKIGLDWNTCFFDSFQLAIGVAYEAQYWWNQWQAAPSVISSILMAGSSPQGDLMLQGLTARLSIAF